MLQERCSMSKAQAEQLERIKKDQMIEAQQKQAKEAMKANQRSAWMESLEDSSDRKYLKAMTEGIKQEIQHSNRALIQVRQHQLKKLMEEEYASYEQELCSMGLKIHRDRI